MKLLFFSNTLKGGGAERVLVNITSELARRGHDITIALNYNESNYELPPTVSVIGAPEKHWYKGINILRRLIRNIFINRFYCRFTRHTIQAVHPDVIITFSQCNMPAIIRYHGTIPIIHSEHNAYDRKLGGRNYINRFYLNRRFDKVFVLTHFDLGYAVARGLKNTMVMPNPNTFNSISSEEYDFLFPQRRNILVCGRTELWKVKGIDIAIKSFASIAEANPEVDLDIVGGCEPNTQSFLQRIADEEGVGQRVHFLGHRSDMLDLYRSHKLLLLSSRTEGFPMVISEAMSQGLPCLAFERLASSMIVDGTDGFFVQEVDVEAMAARMNGLLENNKLIYDAGLAAKESITRFSPMRVADRWERVSIDCLQRKLNKK